MGYGLNYELLFFVACMMIIMQLLCNDCALYQTTWVCMDAPYGWKILPEISSLYIGSLIVTKNDPHVQFVSIYIQASLFMKNDDCQIIHTNFCCSYQLKRILFRNFHSTNSEWLDERWQTDNGSCKNAALLSPN